MCIQRKIVVKILVRNNYKKVARRGLGSSHTKYQRTNEDGTTTSYTLVSRKSLEKKVILDISRVTGIPVEEFYRSGGSKKHQNGFGTIGLINNTSM